MCFSFDVSTKMISASEEKMGSFNFIDEILLWDNQPLPGPITYNTNCIICLDATGKVFSYAKHFQCLCKECNFHMSCIELSNLQSCPLCRKTVTEQKSVLTSQLSSFWSWLVT
jgi:hypothetical protein